jgi:NADP-reducing hydrogenase subunit HndC
VGSQKVGDVLTGWTLGQGARADFEMVDDLTDALKLTSICGLGQFAHSPISSVLQHFRAEVESHVFEKRCPEGVCPMHDRTIA